MRVYHIFLQYIKSYTKIKKTFLYNLRLYNRGGSLGLEEDEECSVTELQKRG